MSPRGFYQKEYIAPHFTSSEYLKSEQGQKEMANLYKVNRTLASLVKYPGQIAKRFYIWILLRAGYLKDINHSS
jgi:hypothetical protein